MRKRTRLLLFLGLLLAGLFIFLLPLVIVPGQAKVAFLASSVRAGVYGGQLASADAVWYRLAAQDLGEAPDQPVALTLRYAIPTYAQSDAVNFEVFSADALPLWQKGFSEVYMGKGSPTGSSAASGVHELAWQGRLKGNKTYYIRVFNDSAQSMAFQFEVSRLQPGAYAGLATAGITQTASTGALTASMGITDTVVPASPYQADAATPGMGIGSASEEAQWQLIVSTIQGMPVQDAVVWLKTAQQLGWVSLDAGRLGAGLLSDEAAWAMLASAIKEMSSRDAVAWMMVASRMGWVSVHGIDVESATTITAVAAGRNPVEATPAGALTSVYPFSPLVIRDGPNVGRLCSGCEHWYRFSRSDGNPKTEEYAVFTMFYTPVDGNTINQTRFEVYPAGQLELWRRGTPDEMMPMGEGSLVWRTADPLVGQRLWAGVVFEGDVYYLRVVNDSRAVVDYYLITGDIWNTELGNRVWAANPVTTHVYQ